MLLARLIDAGMFDEAHDIWVRSLPSDRREEADLLYNKEFRYPLTNLPFDWVIPPVSNAMVRFGNLKMTRAPSTWISSEDASNSSTYRICLTWPRGPIVFTGANARKTCKMSEGCNGGLLVLATIRNLGRD